MVASVGRGVPWVWGGLPGYQGLARPRRYVGGVERAWLGLVVSGGPVGERWLVPACHRWLLRGRLRVGVLLGWSSGGVLEAFGRRWGGLCWVGSRLVDLCVMHRMVMDET